MNRKVIIPLILSLLLLIIIITARCLADSAPKPPPPPPTATPLPTPIAMLKGKVWGCPLFINPKIEALMEQPLEVAPGQFIPGVDIDTKDATLSSSKYATNDLTGVDAVCPGDQYYLDLFTSRDDIKSGKFKILGNPKTIFITKLNLFSWWRFWPSFIKAGYVVEQHGQEGDTKFTFYYVPPEKADQLLRSRDAHKTWKEAGIDFGDELFSNTEIDLAGTDYGSSTGLVQMQWMANCYSRGCGKGLVTVNDLPSTVPFLVRYIVDQGTQAAGSLDAFKEWRANGEGGVAIIAFDSALATTASTDNLKCITSPWDVDKNCPAKNRVVAASLGGSPYATHKYASLSQVGIIIGQHLEDPRIKQIAKEELGMSTLGTEYKSPISWMMGSIPDGPKPNTEVTAEMIRQIREALSVKK